MTKEVLKSRWKAMTLRVINLVKVLPRSITGDVLGRQLIRSASSVTANYRAACKGRSKADFISKLGIVEEEIDETRLWIELIGDCALIPPSRLKELMREVDELASIFAASRITAQRNAKVAKS